MKNKPASGAGMLSTAVAKPKALGLAPPPAGAVKIRSPLPPPPNDPVAARLGGGHGSALNVAQDNSRHSSDALSDLSQLEVCTVFCNWSRASMSFHSPFFPFHM